MTTLRHGGSVSQRETYGKALLELGKTNSRIIALDADVSKSTFSYLFAEEIPDRFFNCGIAEQNMMTMAAGFAAAGLLPFVNTFSFLATFRAGEQFRTSIAYPNLNVKIAANYGGLSDSFDGATHHSLADIATIRAFPNVSVVVPADAIELEKALPVLADHEGPVWLRICRNPTPLVYGEDFEFRFGKATTLQDGSDLTLISTGICAWRVLESAHILLEQGISARVLSLSTIKPLDLDSIVKAAVDTKAIVTCEEHNVLGGLGAAVSEAVTEHYPVPVIKVGVPDIYAESGDYSELLDRYGLAIPDIIKAARRALELKRTV